MEWTTIGFIVLTAVLGIVSIYAGSQWKKVQAKMVQVRDLLDTVIKAAEDNKVTEAEFQAVIASVKKLLNMD